MLRRRVAVAMAGPQPFRGRFCAGAWFWELEEVPQSWRPAMGYVDEVWAGRETSGSMRSEPKP